MSGHDDEFKETNNLSKTDIEGIADAAAEKAANAAVERAANAAAEKALQVYSSRASQLNPMPYPPPPPGHLPYGPPNVYGYQPYAPYPYGYYAKRPKHSNRPSKPQINVGRRVQSNLCLKPGQLLVNFVQSIFPLFKPLSKRLLRVVMMLLL